MKIHKEGYGTLGVVFTLIAVVNVLLFRLTEPGSFYAALIIFGSLLIFVYFLQFFRNPSRNIPEDPDLILSPADGKLVVVEETLEEEYFGDNRLQVSIFMSPLNVHSNRSPVSGTVSYVKYHPGRFLVAWHPKSSKMNERSTIVIKRDDGTEILLRQIAGAVARRIKTYPSVGDRLELGEEFGFIKFGSRVDIFLPTGTEVLPALGEKMKAGLSPLVSVANEKRKENE